MRSEFLSSSTVYFSLIGTVYFGLIGGVGLMDLIRILTLRSS